jgi:polysaccharide export outer membrane protein
MLVCAGWTAVTAAQQAAPPAAQAPAIPSLSASVAAPTAPVSGAATDLNPPEYRIGPGDVLGVLFWRDKELSTDVVVRPDGRISLPVMNEMPVVGLSTDELRVLITERARKYVADPIVSVVVREIRSRYVFITGKVNKPGPYQLYGPMSVLQLIAMAAGVQEYAEKTGIVIVRDENGKQQRLPFNYNDVVRKGDLSQNVMLRPGDTVVVP